MPENEILCGTLLAPETVNETDFPIEAVALEKIGQRQADAVPCGGNVRPHAAVHQLDLAPHGGVSCFYAAAFACAADAWPLSVADKTKALQAFKDGWAAIVRDGKVTPGFGGRFADGVDYARRAWNAAFPDRKVKSFRGKVDSHEFYRALSLGWKVMIGRFVGKDELQDILADGDVDDNTRASDDYGHATGYFSKSCTVDLVQDQYAKRPGFPNAYELADFQTKVANGVVFPSFYLFVRA